MFDAQQILKTALEAPLSTRMQPCPVGEYIGTIQPFDDKTFQSGTGKETGEPYTRMSVWIEVVGDPRIKAALDIDKKKVRYQFLLDVLPNGSLDMSKGKNISLGRLMEAAGLNSLGASISSLPGRSVKISVSHRVDPKDAEVIYEDVKSVTKI